MSENARLPRNIQGSFPCRKSTTWDRRLFFPSERRRAERFFASAGFGPANLGTKGQHATSGPQHATSRPQYATSRTQHATSRPPKPQGRLPCILHFGTICGESPSLEQRVGTERSKLEEASNVLLPGIGKFIDLSARCLVTTPSELFRVHLHVVQNRTGGTAKRIEPEIV